MSSKLALPPIVAPETMQALLSATVEFAAAKPWKILADCDLVGLTDTATGETRLGTVLGNGGEVFGAVIYRRPGGLRWILNMLNGEESFANLDAMDGMDCLKMEMVAKHELEKPDLSLLKSLNFKPSGSGHVWPQFRSSTPGWMPWFIDQTEAEQLLADLPRLTQFHALLKKHPDLFEVHPVEEIPFLPNPMPDRPLALADLDWRPIVSLPETHEPFRATEEQLAQLRSLRRVPQAGYEYACRILPGGSVLENGRPCCSRMSLLVEPGSGFVAGAKLSPAPQSFSQNAGQGLVEPFIKHGILPGQLWIEDARLDQVLRPFCDALEIKLSLVEGLDDLYNAMDSLSDFMQRGPR